MPAPGWVAKFIGVPFVEHGRSLGGADCWGLAKLAAADLGLEFPDYGYLAALDKREIGGLVRASAAAPPWREVAFTERRAGDVVTFNVLGFPAHVGLVVDRDFFLHVGAAAAFSVLGRFAAMNWRNRVDGVFRYEP